jgi:hypothetical protein
MWIDEAKQWTREEADAQIRATRGTHRWAKWPLLLVEKLARRTVDIQDLDRVINERKKKNADARAKAKAKKAAAVCKNPDGADGQV